MNLNTKALGLTAGILWGGAIFLSALANLIWPGYAQACLDVAASIYPGYDATASFGQVIIGTLYGLVDGFVCGVIFGWLYNLLAGKTAAPAELG